MNTANYVDEQIKKWTKEERSKQYIAWNTALLCVGWPYVFGAWGAYCTTAERKKRYKPAYPTIYSACQVLRSNNPKKDCNGCKWFPDGERVRCFDCRGFTDWVLKQVGIDLQGEGATSQWNTASNWSAKGTIDSMPKDTLVCLFYTDKNNKKVMAHTGFGLNNETVECSSGVQHFTSRNKKWTHWAVPKGIKGGDVPPEPTPEPDKKPTLRKGDKGEYVNLLQTKLIQKGYDIGSYGVDGKFGSQTQNAVKEFQKDHGLTADGVVGEKTWEALEAKESNLYTVKIPHMPKYKAEALIKQYPGASMKAEE